MFADSDDSGEGNSYDFLMDFDLLDISEYLPSVDFGPIDISKALNGIPPNNKKSILLDQNIELSRVELETNCNECGTGRHLFILPNSLEQIPRTGKSYALVSILMQKATFG